MSAQGSGLPTASSTSEPAASWVCRRGGLGGTVGVEQDARATGAQALDGADAMGATAEAPSRSDERSVSAPAPVADSHSAYIAGTISV
jgi:hypothetical protein